MKELFAVVAVYYLGISEVEVGILQITETEESAIAIKEEQEATIKPKMKGHEFMYVTYKKVNVIK